MKWPAHGANPQYLYESFKMTMPENYLDFSVNVNPFGRPAQIDENWNEWLAVVSNYPDPQVRKLKKLIADANKMSEEMVLVGNGGAELIFSLGIYLRERRVLIVQPAFSEYEEACQVNGCQLFYHSLQEGDWDFNADELIKSITDLGAEAIFLCTPNNPTGVVYDEEEMLDLLNFCKSNKLTVIIDEAFYDFHSVEKTYANYLQSYPNLIVLRSLTKMYAIAGLRLGYILGNELVINKLAKYKPHWSVNNIAIEAGLVCLTDSDFVESTLETIESEKERLFSFFQKEQFSFSKSKTNFYLLKDSRTDDQLPLFKYLLQRGIVPRHTANFPSLDSRWLRFAVKKPAENDKLMEVLKKWRSEN